MFGCVVRLRKYENHILKHVYLITVFRGDNANDKAHSQIIQDGKVHGANMRPTWVLSAPDGPHVGSMNLAIREFLFSVVWPTETIS